MGNDFQYFKNPEERKKLLKFVERAVEYVHRRKIRVVVAGGTSAQPLLYLFRAVWKRRYPNERISFFTLPRAHIGMLPPERIKEMIKRCRAKLAEKLESNEPVFLLEEVTVTCLLYTSPSPRDRQKSRMPSSA